MRLWDLRINKSIMMMSDSTISDGVIKCKFIDSTHIIGCSQNKYYLYDSRKPSIVIKSSTLIHEAHSDEINDIDIKIGETIKISSCDDSGIVRVYEFNTETLILKMVNSLESKHTNVCFKCKFSS
jgi:WD40 repeat protein